MQVGRDQVRAVPGRVGVEGLGGVFLEGGQRVPGSGEGLGGGFCQVAEEVLGAALLAVVLLFVLLFCFVLFCFVLFCFVLFCCWIIEGFFVRRKER